MLEPLAKFEPTQLKFIEHGSDEYLQAAQLRYQIFYQEHNIPFASIFTPREERDLHLVITASSTNHVLAYGRLEQTCFNEFQIYQMVVAPECQGHGLGTRILQSLVTAAMEQGARLVSLHARTTKMQFYQKSGFKPIGDEFASSMTGVSHITMQKEMLP